MVQQPQNQASPFSSVCQIGVIVRDLDEAVKHYLDTDKVGSIVFELIQPPREVP